MTWVVRIRYERRELTFPRELCSRPDPVQLDGRRRDRVFARDGQHQRRRRMRFYALHSRRELARKSAVVLPSKGVKQQRR